jgi:hypothetical protein
MFLVEMFHFVGEKERQIKAIFKRAGYNEGPGTHVRKLGLD